MSQTAETLRRADPEPHRVSRESDCCANGHRWTPDTTRWRFRARGGRHGSGWERDCLVCKAVSEGRRRKLRVGERTYQ
ncbi:hypothetical protein GCM10009785_21830 [Brooklawnia cerclae]|uniref:Uncharacterized protein n=1 Tax=Brooklawnia cerclae TaxID=349934 RepID=A0ABX0SFZ5_9ACTN|nr:hypothetical protein [Brooklawnia cerclae]